MDWWVGLGRGRESRRRHSEVLYNSDTHFHFHDICPRFISTFLFSYHYLVFIQT